MDYLKQNKLKKKISYYGIDISKKQIKLAMKKTNKIYILNIDNNDLPFKNNYFDLVISTEVIEHIFNTNHFLKEINRVLKKEGITIITTPNIVFLGNCIVLLFGIRPPAIEFRIKNSLGHIRAFTKKDLEVLFEENKLKIINILGRDLYINKLPKWLFKPINILIKMKFGAPTLKRVGILAKHYNEKNTNITT